MGVIIAHGYDPSGTHFRQQELDTIACLHCGSVITIYIKNLGKRPDTPYRCARCNGPICMHCGQAQARGKPCIPYKARIDRAVKLRDWADEFDFHYNSCTRV